MADDKELESLSDFVNSEGFRLFSERVTREWGPSGMRFQQAVRNAAAVGGDATSRELQIVLKVQEEIIGLMSWPNQRVDQLKQLRQPQPSVVSRRGPGL